jgi:hypothetical protein
MKNYKSKLKPNEESPVAGERNDESQVAGSVEYENSNSN